MTATSKKWPPEDQRDLSLGRFMDAWSDVEQQLRFLLQQLSGTDGAIAYAISAAVPDLGRMRDLLKAIGSIRLQGSDLAELDNICSDVQRQAQHRNTIVHGRWGLTNNVEQTPILGVIHDLKWVRVYNVVDQSIELQAVLGKNEKAQRRYVFSVARLDERSVKARSLAQRITALALRVPTDRPGQEAGTQARP